MLRSFLTVCIYLGICHLAAFTLQAVVILPCCYATNLLGGYCWICPPTGNDFPCHSSQNEECGNCKQISSFSTSHISSDDNIIPYMIPLAGNCSKCTSPLPNTGMPNWIVTEPILNVHIQDTPLFYPPTRGKVIAFDLSYKNTMDQDEANEAENIDSNQYYLGRRWSTHWRSYLKQTDVVDCYEYYNGIGGRQIMSIASTNAYQDACRLVRVNNGILAIQHPGGSMDIFSRGNLGGDGIVRYQLTESRDPYGNTTLLSYNTIVNSSRTFSVLSSITDIDGKKTLLSYTNISHSPLVSSVTDPYGHVMLLEYDNELFPNLTKITDIVGITSYISYNNKGEILSLTTPYTNTRFSSLPDINGLSNRGIIVNETGIHSGSRNYLFVYADFIGTNILTSSFNGNRPSTTNLVSGFSFPNTFDSEYMNQHNSFYWGPSQFTLLPKVFTQLISSNYLDLSYLYTSNYMNSRMRHWLLITNTSTTDSSVSTTISIERGVSRDGLSPGKTIWFDYQGKVPENPSLIGITSQPSIIAELLPSGDSHFMVNNRNLWGIVTNHLETYGDSINNLGIRSTSFQYSSDGIDLISIVDSLGRQIVSNQFNGSHQLVSSYNAFDEICRYRYDDQGRLSSISYPSGLNITNIYGLDGNIKDIIEVGYSTNSYSWFGGRSRTVMDARGLITTNYWDAIGRLEKIVYPDGTFVSNRFTNLDLVDSMDRLGGHSKWNYDDFRNLISFVDPEGRTNRFVYCDCGELISKIDSLNEVTTFDYDLTGQITRVSFPDNSFVKYQYDQSGRRFSRSDSSGYTVTNLFNNAGKIVRKCDIIGCFAKFDYDVFGRVTNFIGRNAVQIASSFDSAGRLTNRYYSDRGTVSLGYSYGLFFPTIVSNSIGTIFHFSYNSHNLLASEVTPSLGTNLFFFSPAGDLTKVSSNNGWAEIFSRDTYGRITNISDLQGNIIFNSLFDVNGRAISVFGSTKGPLTILYDRLGNITNIVNKAHSVQSYIYDLENHLVSMNDETGISAWKRDYLGRPLSEDGPWNGDVVSISYTNFLRSALLIQGPILPTATQTYSYDSVQRLSTISGLEPYRFNWSNDGRYLLTGVMYPNGVFVTNVYNASSRIGNIVLKSSSNVLIDTQSYLYNSAGVCTLQLFPLGNILAYQYNGEGYLAGFQGFMSVGGPQRSQEADSYNYDSFGNLAYRTNGALIEGLLVTPKGDIFHSTNSGSFRVSGIASASPTSIAVNSTLTQLYTDSSFVSDVFSIPIGPTNLTAVGVDRLGRRDTNSITVNFEAGRSFSYDRYGNLVWDGLHAYDYTVFNQLAQVVAGASNKVEYTYDGLFRRRIAREFAWSGSGTNLGLSAITNLSYPLRNDFSGWVGCSLKTGANPLVISYLGRIVARGNSANHSLKLVRADATDCPGGLTVLNTSGLTSGQFGYAPLTNPVVLEANSVYYLLSQETAGGDSWYDLGSPVSTRSAAALVGGVLSPTNSGVYTVTGSTNQTFGPLDMRFSPGTWNLAKETRYVYDGRLVVQERNGQNVPTVTYVRGPDRSGTLTGAAGVGGLLARISHDGSLPQKAYYYSDASGNVAGMFSPQGNLVASYRYDPFGNLLGMSGPLAEINRYRFSSQEVQPITGQYDFGFRTYDPSLQRWLTRDPIGPLGGWNPYQFVGNNPINRTDRYGLSDADEEPDPNEGSDSYCAELLARISNIIAGMGTGNSSSSDGVMLELLMDEWLNKCRNYDTLPTASEECLETLPGLSPPAPGSRNRSPVPVNPPSTFCSRNPDLCVGIGIGIIGIGVGATCLFQPELCAIAVRVGVGVGRGLIPGVVVAL